MPSSNNPNQLNLNSMDQLLINAMESLRLQIEKNTNFLVEQTQKVEKDIPLRDQQTPGYWKGYNSRLSSTYMPNWQNIPKDPDKGPSTQMPGGWDTASMPPDSQERTSNWDQFKKNYAANRLGNVETGQQAQGVFQAALGSLSQFGTNQTASGVSPNASQATRQQGVFGQILHPAGVPNGQQSSDEQALTWAILGEHGGPALVRNAYLEQYGLQRSMGWAQQTAATASNWVGGDSFLGRQVGKIPGVSPDTMAGLSGLFGLATRNPWAVWAGYKGLQGINSAYQAGLAGQAFGQQFGYGPGIGGPSIFGMNNPLGAAPFNTATQVGAANQQLGQVLQGQFPAFGLGGTLTGSQAAGVTSTVAGQGFAVSPLGGGGVGGTILTGASQIPVVGGMLSGLLSGIFGGSPTGDAVKIAQNFMQPLISQFPGITGQELGDFTPALRNSATSIEQLKGSLQDLSDESRTTKMTIGEFTSSLAQTGQQFEAMGSSFQGGVALGGGFTDITGLPPQVAGQIAQSPIFQGMTLSRYGILPSGIGDMNAGAFTNTTLATLQLMQRATSGFDRPIYDTINGRRILVEPGKIQQYDQIAKMTGIPSNLVKRILGDQSGIAARAKIGEALGQEGNSTGIWGLVQQLGLHNANHLNKSQANQLNAYWNQTIAPNFKGTGISPQEAQRLNREPIAQRLHDLRVQLNKANQADSWNQINRNPNANTITLKLTGAAAKALAFDNGKPSISKMISNAGGPPYGGTLNQVLGDVTTAPKLGR